VRGGRKKKNIRDKKGWKEESIDIHYRLPQTATGLLTSISILAVPELTFVQYI